MRSLGPAFGGVLILWIGAGGNFLVQAGTYALIALTVTRLRFPQRASGPNASSSRNLSEGIRYILRNRDTRAFVLIGWALPLLIIPNYDALTPIYAKDVFGGGPGILGLILSSVGIGGIVGGVVAASLGNLDRRGLLQMVSLGMTGLSLIGFALSPNLWVALVMFGMSGFWEMIFLTNNQTLLQLSIPDEVRGRVMGIVTLNSGLSPIGGVVAGIGADFFGPASMTLAFCGVAVAIAIGVLIGSPMIRGYRLSEAIERGSSTSADHT
jgi:MFS family permease